MKLCRGLVYSQATKITANRLQDMDQWGVHSPLVPTLAIQNPRPYTRMKREMRTSPRQLLKTQNQQ